MPREEAPENLLVNPALLFVFRRELLRHFHDFVVHANYGVPLAQDEVNHAAPGFAFPACKDRGLPRFDPAAAGALMKRAAGWLLAAAAAALSPIGIDVEPLARVPEFGWAKIAVESEMKLIEGAPHRISGLATPLLQLWTAKEAASKAARVGLADGGLVRWRLIAVGLNRGWLVEDQRTRLHYGVHSAAKGQWLLACASRHR